MQTSVHCSVPKMDNIIWNLEKFFKLDKNVQKPMVWDVIFT